MALSSRAVLSQSAPSRWKISLLIIFIIGGLIIGGFILMIKSRSTESAPQSPSQQPISNRNNPANPMPGRTFQAA